VTALRKPRRLDWPDRLSGWTLPPPAAWAAGDAEPVRVLVRASPRCGRGERACSCAPGEARRSGWLLIQPAWRSGAVCGTAGQCALGRRLARSRRHGLRDPAASQQGLAGKDWIRHELVRMDPGLSIFPGKSCV
jgi:hypothetical protein